MKFEDSIFFPGDPEGLIKEGFSCLKADSLITGVPPEMSTAHEQARVLKEIGCAAPALIALTLGQGVLKPAIHEGNDEVVAEDFSPRVMELAQAIHDLDCETPPEHLREKLMASRDESVWQYYIAEGIVNLDGALTAYEDMDPETPIPADDDNEDGSPRMTTVRQELRAVWLLHENAIKPIAERVPQLQMSFLESLGKVKDRLESWPQPKPLPKIPQERTPVISYTYH